MGELGDMIKTRAGYTEAKSCSNCVTVGNARPLRCHAFEKLLTMQVDAQKVCGEHAFRSEVDEYPADVDKDNSELQNVIESHIFYLDCKKCLGCLYFSDSDSHCLRFKELETFEVDPEFTCNFFS